MKTIEKYNYKQLEYGKCYYELYGEGKSHFCGRFTHRGYLEVVFEQYDSFLSDSGGGVEDNTYRRATFRELFLLWMKGELP